MCGRVREGGGSGQALLAQIPLNASGPGASGRGRGRGEPVQDTTQPVQDRWLANE